MISMSSEDEDRKWVINKFKSIVNPFLRKNWDAHEVSQFWDGLILRTSAMDKPSAVVATTINLIEPDTPPDKLGNVINNLMYDFITKSSVKEMEMDDATELLRNNVNTHKGIIGLFGTRMGMRAWYITCGNWILCNADITAPKAKTRVSKPMEWKDVFDGGGPESDIKMYYFTDGAALLAPPKLRKVSMSAGVRGRKGGTTYIQKSRIIPKLLLYTTVPLLNWKDLPTQFLFND